MIRTLYVFLSTSFMLGALLLCGCDEEVSLDGAGQACIASTDEWPTQAQTFVENEPLHIIVRLHECLSSSCHSGMYASCTALLDPSTNVITIESEGGYTDESASNSSCTTDCVLLEAHCQTSAPLEAGTYTVVYGDEDFELTIPGDPTWVICAPPLSL